MVLGNIYPDASVDLGTQASAFPISTLQSMNPQTPAVQSGGGGMFGSGGAWRYALASALAGFVSRRNPELAKTMMEPMQMQRQMQMMGIQNQMEYQRQLALAQAQAKLKLQYPDDPFSTAEVQGGVMPGTPQWVQDHRTRAQNELDPVVNVEGVGPMLRSQILAGQGAAGQPAPQGITFTPIQGGQTPQASGHFLGS